MGVFIQSHYEERPHVPDIQYSHDIANIKDLYMDPISAREIETTPTSYYDGILMRPILLHPRSRGNIQLNHTGEFSTIIFLFCSFCNNNKSG